jgi:hypothetical protein
MNLRNAILIVILFFTFIQSKGQSDTVMNESDHKINFSISGGVAIPVGNFSEYDLDTHSSTKNLTGVASEGFNGKLEFGYLFSKNFGVTSMFYSSFNKASIDSADLYNQSFSTALGGGTRILTSEYQSEEWITTSFLAGLILRPNTKNVIINFKITGGIQKVQTPEARLYESGFTWQLNWPNNHPFTSTIIQPSMISYNFVFDLGLNLQNNLSKKIGLVYGMDYMISRATFSGEKSYATDSNDGINQTHYDGKYPIEFAQNIALLNFNIGLSYMFK